MSFSLIGIPVSRGIAIGKAHIIAPAALDVEHYLIAENECDKEIARLIVAQTQVQDELTRLRKELPKDAPEEMGVFLDVHSMILHDHMLMDEAQNLIRKRLYNAEWALTTQLEILVKQFDEIEDEYLRERKADIEQVVERVLKALAGAGPLMMHPEATIKDDIVVVAHDIAPADMLQFKRQPFAGFVTDLGGKTSHTAIVARSLDIPAAVGVQNASHLIRQNDWIIIDGDAGIVVVDPTPMILEEYRHRQSERMLEKKKLQRLKFTPTQTLDGVAIHLMANIEMPVDAAHALEAGAVGVGLFRSEFLFMGRKDLPTEEEQFLAYKQAVESMKGLPVTIRTIDIGNDKPLDHQHNEGFENAPNPALGLRAIRWSLAEPKMFRTQLRAILRASAYGQVKILIPMLAHAQEIDQTLELINQAKIELDKTGKAFDPTVKIGAMIEIPAAVLALPIFLRRMDFLSIGTNDLIQYTLAIDRADNTVAHLYDPLHPAVLHLLARTIKDSQQANIPVSVCGEMAGDPTATRLLLALGLTEFSMHPTQLLGVKKEILHADRAKLRKLVGNVLASYEPEDLAHALHAIKVA